MFSDILPNVVSVVIVLFPLMIATTIFTEAALSFLSSASSRPTSSWGTIISDGQQLLYTRPVVAIAPGIMIVLTVLALNVLGDGIRDALDPRAKLRVEGRRGHVHRPPDMLLRPRGDVVITLVVFMIFFHTPDTTTQMTAAPNASESVAGAAWATSGTML